MSVFTPKKIFIEEPVHELPLTQQILKKYPQVPTVYVRRAKEFIHQWQTETAHRGPEKETLLICQNRGRFLEPCPGTKNYLCCGYVILNTGTGCPLNCSYCVLQAYLNNPFITIFANLHDMWNELAVSVLLQQNKTIRLGTGEYGDSLALEHLTHFVPAIAAFLKKRTDIILELKTKTTAIESLIDLDHGGSIIVSWSLNSVEICQQEEPGAAPIEARITAARRVAEEGYKVGFHFDPLIFYPGWEKGYQNVIDLISRHIPPSAIAWVSLGSLRFIPSLKAINQSSLKQSRIFAEEFIPGLDGKLRYFQQIRIELYAQLVSWLRDYSPDLCIYLCMESPAVWKKSIGRSPASNWALKQILDDQCG